MSRIADGTEYNIELPPGIYEYKFLVDGIWCCKPGVDESPPQLLNSGQCAQRSWNYELQTASLTMRLLECRGQFILRTATPEEPTRVKLRRQMKSPLLQ